MFDDPLDPIVRQALIDRFEGWEIVELLGLSAEDVIEAFLDQIIEKDAAVREELGLEPETPEDD
jgi:hypothetical protein